ncbi:MAG: Gfo/Idh/MocA family protein [Armatimonadota bacterium]
MSYRAGIIGCGGISRHHARAYRNDPRIELVAAAEPDPAKRNTFASDYGVKTYPSASEMLGDAKLDLVSVCTPHPGHREPVEQAAQAGVRAILCEKPLAMNLTDADAMIACCRQRGVLLIVGHQRRFQPGHVAIAKPIREGELGALTDIYFDVHHYDLMTWGTHGIDMIRWYNHELPTASVFGHVDISTVHNRHGGQAEDSAISCMTFQNGLRAIMACGSMVPYWRQVIVGEKATLRVEGEPSRAIIRSHRGSDWREIPKPDHDDWQEGFDGEVRAMVDSLETGAVHELNADSAREALAIIMATYQSSRLRRVITFPVAIPDNPLLAMIAEKGQ